MLGCRVHGVGFRGCSMFRAEGLRFGVGFRVQVLGLRASGFGVQGLGSGFRASTGLMNQPNTLL